MKHIGLVFGLFLSILFVLFLVGVSHIVKPKEEETCTAVSVIRIPNMPGCVAYRLACTFQLGQSYYVDCEGRITSEAK